MALTIYPDSGYDSFISISDADTIITENSIQSSSWLSLDDATKEVYLRIAFSNIYDVISTDSNSDIGYLDIDTYVSTNSCLPKTNAMMAIHDLSYGLSSEINPNMGTITKEKVGDLEVQYQHDYKERGRVSNRFPNSVKSCLNYYGATLQTGCIKQATLIRS